MAKPAQTSSWFPFGAADNWAADPLLSIMASNQGSGARRLRLHRRPTRARWRKFQI
jgi:hypothetical protein